MFIAPCAMVFVSSFRSRQVYFAPKGASLERDCSNYKYFAPSGARSGYLGWEGTANHDIKS